MADGWEILSQIVGWIYFLAWNFSFYPQSFQLYKLKDSSGFSVNYALLNITGFFFYTLYNTVGLVNPNVGTGNIEIQDMFFTYNALLMTTFQVTQSMIYPRGKLQRVFTWNIYLLSIMWGAVVVVFFLEGVIDVGNFGTRFNTVMMGGYCKALITFVKYCPQVYLNFKRKSTVGWNIYNILLDFTGGSFSLLQQLIDTLRTGSNQFFTGEGFNIVKFFLSICSIFFDLIFMFQHFVLYRHSRKPVDASPATSPQSKESLLKVQMEKSDDFDQFSAANSKEQQNLNVS